MVLQVEAAEEGAVRHEVAVPDELILLAVLPSAVADLAVLSLRLRNRLERANPMLGHVGGRGQEEAVSGVPLAEDGLLVARQTPRPRTPPGDCSGPEPPENLWLIQRETHSRIPPLQQRPQLHGTNLIPWRELHTLGMHARKAQGRRSHRGASL